MSGITVFNVLALTFKTFKSLVIGIIEVTLYWAAVSLQR